MVNNYLIHDFVLKRKVESSGCWSDGEGRYDAVRNIKGHMRLLRASETKEGREGMILVYRLYTTDNDVRHGDLICKCDKPHKAYKVRVVDSKEAFYSGTKFYQIDCVATI